MEDLYFTPEAYFSEKGELILYSCNSDIAEDFHWHRNLEVILVTSGTCLILINNKRYSMSENDFCLIPSGTPHSILSNQGNCIQIFIKSELYLSHSFFQLYQYRFYPASFFWYQQDTQNMIDLIIQLKQHIQSGYPLSSAKGQNLISSLLTKAILYWIDINQIYPSSRSHSIDFYTDSFYQVCNYIHEHCFEEISISEVSSLSGFSTSYFSQLFKKITGVTFYEYQRNQRLSYALDLLATTNLTIDEIHSLCGYQSLATFHRLFLSAFHEPPLVYRKKYLHF